MTLERYREAMHNQHEYTNRAERKRCLDLTRFSGFTRTPLKSVSPRWHDEHLVYAHKRHERAQHRSSRCLPDTVSEAIEYYFGPYAYEAHLVASCESGHSIYAVNGQYVGVFQMGTWERSTYGWYVVGDPPAVQVRSAHNYFVASGSDWSPWACRP